MLVFTEAMKNRGIVSDLFFAHDIELQPWPKKDQKKKVEGEKKKSKKQKNEKKT